MHNEQNNPDTQYASMANEGDPKVDQAMDALDENIDALKKDETASDV